MNMYGFLFWRRKMKRSENRCPSGAAANLVARSWALRSVRKPPAGVCKELKRSLRNPLLENVKTRGTFPGKVKTIRSCQFGLLGGLVWNVNIWRELKGFLAPWLFSSGLPGSESDLVGFLSCPLQRAAGISFCKFFSLFFFRWKQICGSKSVRRARGS